MGIAGHVEKPYINIEERTCPVEAVRPITPTSDPVEVLDLGAGTGLELSGLLAKAPKAKVTAIDLSAEMLDRLQGKYEERSEQLKLVRDSYLNVPLGETVFDYAISVMSMHHLLSEVEVDMYRRILRALKPGGAYLEGDYVVSEDEAQRCLAE